METNWDSVFGAVIGVDLTKGMRAVSRRKITVIMVGWVLAPTCAAVLQPCCTELPKR
jgi:phosphate/sulfate permease